MHNIQTIQAYLTTLTKKNLDYIYLGKEIIVTIKDIRKDENNNNRHKQFLIIGDRITYLYMTRHNLA